MKKTTAIFVCLLMTLSAISALIPFTGAQSSGELASYAYVTVAPNPVGVGQTTYIAMWVDVPLPDANESNAIRRHDYSLKIIAPDGTTEDYAWDIIWDTTGVKSMAYTPDQTGNYTIYFSYADQTYTWNDTSTQKIYYGLKLLGDNATTTLTVQEAAVTPTADTPITSEYWSRPIYGTNDNWYTIGSHWLAGSYLGTFQQSNMNFWQQSGIGPNSSHILWTSAVEAGGVVGGTNTYIDGATFYSGGSYEGRFLNSIIMNGRLYYKAPLSDAATNGPYICTDLRTGEELWRKDNINPTFGELFAYESPNQHGVIPSGYLWATSGTTWIAYDGYTGNWLFNLTNVPSTGTIAYTENGEIVKYILNYNTTSKSGWLALWNWTCAPSAMAGTSGSDAMQLRPVGKIIDCSKAYSWNKTITADLTGLASPSIAYVLPGDVLLGTSFASGIITRRTTSPIITVWALNLEKDREGQLLWKKSFDAPNGNQTRTLGPLDPVNRVWTMTDAETMQWLGYSLEDGNLLWGPTDTEIRAMQYFSSGSGANQKAVTAYGNIYVQGFGGELFCYDTATGDLVWKYSDTNSGVDSSWGLMPIFISAIADGKVYAFNNEHSPNSPLYNGYSIYCLNATTGEEIYKMLSWEGQSGGAGISTGILADGTLVYYNYYDNQLYSIAKGPSQTTVTAPNSGLDSGQSVIISGTVTDNSPGTAQNEQKSRFPNGVACASDASMSDWMEYVYMDQSLPTNFTGVEVIISVVDANGNYRTIGTANTDSSGLYGLQWTPDISGKYTVIATFAGTNGYYGSYAKTYFAVDEPVEPTTPQPTAQPSAADLYFIPAIIGVIIAIIIVGAVLALLVTKKP